MSHCQKCNAELPDGARFCGKCGFAQLPAGAFSVVATQTPQGAVVNAVETEDAVKPVADTPPVSPAVSLIPTRTVHPGLKQATLPGGAGSAFLRPPDSEPLKKIVGEVQVFPTLGQREPASDMIPETPEPGVTRSSESEPVKQPETKGQIITTPPAPSVPVTKSVQFKSRAWSGTSGGNSQQPAPEQSQAGPANMPDPVSLPGMQPPLAGRSPGLIRQVGFSPSPLQPASPSTPVQQGLSTPAQSGQVPVKPGSVPAFPPIVPPPAASGSSMQQPVAPAQNSQFPFEPGQQQVVRESSPSPWQRPGAGNRSPWQAAGVVDKPQSDPIDVFGVAEPELGRLGSTSKAAEHWRQSWRDRQRAEAGPAEGVSRGHAHVPMPLMAMQQSLARMRAIILANKEQDTQPKNLGFWITLLLMFCLIGGLGAYIISSYIPNSPLGSARVVPPASPAQPSLVAQNTTIETGQSLHVHGDHFGSNQAISFLLDTTQPIVDASGHNISAQTDAQGTFDANIPVGNDWATGNHVIEAMDSGSNQFAYLTINVLPAGTPSATSNNLTLLFNGQPLHELSFTAVVGQDNPSQRFTLENTSGAPLKWSATAAAANNLTWLVINDNHTSGTLNISGTDSIGVSAIITGLQSSKVPYKGQIIFTINDSEQLTLPVQLTVNDAPSELVFSPDPIIAHYLPGGTCQSGAALTLINLGEQVISWKLGIDGNTSAHLHFSSVQGQLAPSDESTPQFSSTQVVTLTCSGVQAGSSYTVTLYANGAQWSEQIFIQT
ncbi:MAG TPA: zinc-ribbon domain-containing protein [Ktedonobacteraceae bacterium]|nr:zinc-ribbon domain-containing protein [Ktedonobacteraceae bacterium]